MSKEIKLIKNVIGVYCIPKVNDPEDCEHSDLEDAICLDCGKDLTEKLMCDAYDRAKDRWKE
jgi:hypothetical protein